MGGEYPRPGQFHLPELRKYHIDFGGAMILGEGEYPHLKASFPESEKYHQEMKITIDFDGAMIHGQRIPSPRVEKYHREM